MKRNYLISFGVIFSVVIISSILVPFLVPDTVIRFSNDTSSRTNEAKTLASFKKMDQNNPFYVMKYYGDYEFQEILENGRYLDSEINIEEGWGCTCFSALNSTGPIFGRNFDWRDDGALFLYTEPSYGFASISTVNLGILGLDPYIDFNSPITQERLLLAPYYLMDGMNEVGLIVGIMAINRASRTYNSSQVTISSLDIVRLALEFSSTVDEALILWENYNIEFDSVPIHYLIADSEGNSAIVEWIDGDMYIYRNENNWQVSTNFIFTDGISSCWRYQTATQMLDECEGYVSMEKGMKILEACSQDDWTRWSNIYNMKTLEVHITVNENYQTTYTFQL
ncbi:MAG: carcinine hydrolase/isopenicillin-N N-acyltransferase family protein [Promethearchaeota archaeon]